MKNIEVDKYWFALGEVCGIFQCKGVMYLSLRMADYKVLKFECCQNLKEIYDELIITDKISLRFEFIDPEHYLIKEIIKRGE